CLDAVLDGRHLVGDRLQARRAFALRPPVDQPFVVDALEEPGHRPVEQAGNFAEQEGRDWRAALIAAVVLDGDAYPAGNVIDAVAKLRAPQRQAAADAAPHVAATGVGLLSLPRGPHHVPLSHEVLLALNIRR